MNPVVGEDFAQRIAAMEAWAPIPFRDQFSVSTFGRVFNYRKQKLVSIHIDKAGFPSVTLNGSGIAVHTLMGLAFVLPRVSPVRRNCMQFIEHIDGDRENNLISNLQYGRKYRRRGPAQTSTKRTIRPTRYIYRPIAGMHTVVLPLGSYFTREQAVIVRDTAEERMGRTRRVPEDGTNVRITNSGKYYASITIGSFRSLEEAITERDAAIDRVKNTQPKEFAPPDECQFLIDELLE